MVPDEPNDDAPATFPVVALGASAGGLSALRAFFGAVPTDLGMAFVVVQHLAPDRHSELSQILQRATSMAVHQIDSDCTLEPDQVYVIAPDSDLIVQDNVLYPGTASVDRSTHVSIDHFFQSLAADRHHDAVGIILSGSRSDGSRGIVAIKEHGGVTFAQSPAEAEYPSMPRSAIDTGRVDLVLPVTEIAARLVSIASIPPGDSPSEGAADSTDDAFQGILKRVHSVSGHDFTQYKQSTLARRIELRRHLLQLDSLTDLLDHLREDDDATMDLFDEFLIGVTGFFRDPGAFEALRSEVLADLVASHNGEPIRIWVPACSTGEEAYTLAILLLEEARRQETAFDFKIFATDIDRAAVEAARRGTYPTTISTQLTPERLSRFFQAVGETYQVRKPVRDRILFALHDVLKDPPFARQNLISCRNLLIYLKEKAQRSVFETLHYALKPQGFLFLGESEFLGSSSDLFAAVDSAHRIFRPRNTDKRPIPMSDLSSRSAVFQPALTRRQGPSEAVTLTHLHNDHLARHYAPPSVLVDKDFRIKHIVGDVRPYLRVAPGRPTTDILKTVQPQLRLRLRSALVSVFEDQQESFSSPIPIERQGTTQTLCIRVRFIAPSKRLDHPFALITFEPTDPESLDTMELTAEAPDDASLLETVSRLEEEIDQTRQELDLTIERYETTMEELQTSNEELLTINEELQSTTEELETSTEELQSTNEELIAVNEELSHKITLIDDVNNDLRNLLSATDIGTLFLDREMNLRRFTAPTREYFNVLETDRGRPLEHITHRLRHPTLVSDARDVLGSLQPKEFTTKSLDDRYFLVRILPYRTSDDRIDGVVITFFDITDRQTVLDKLQESELLFRTVFENASDSLFLFHLEDDNRPSRFVEVNDSACDHLGYSQVELTRMTLLDIMEAEGQHPEAYLQQLVDSGHAVSEVSLRTRSGEPHQVELSSRRFLVSAEQVVLSIGRDIARRKTYEEGLVLAKEESERLAELRAAFLANMSHEIRTPLTSIIGFSQLLSQDQLSERQQEMVQLIRTSGRRLHQTLDSVLDISRIEAGEMVPSFEAFDAAKQVREDVEILRTIADQKDLTLTLEGPSEGLTFRTDPGFLTRIVYNLVENAIKFTSEGSILVRLFLKDENLYLIVSDTGIGMSEEFIPRLFDKFKQASLGVSRTFEGSGLGLSLVKTLIDMVEGSIEVESTLGEGTTFTVCLPPPKEDS